MKSILKYIFILIMIFGITIPNLGFAQNPPVGNCVHPDGSVDANVPQSSCTGAADTWRMNAGGTPTVTNLNTTRAAAGAVVDTAKTAIFGNVFEWFTSALAFIGYEILIKITAWILGLSGILLDQVISTTIITMTQKVNAMAGINTAWQITRDLMNIAFIFLLIYEGIKLIIGSGSSTEIKKLITGIVLASLLINFSLFFTKVLIDASNIVTIGLYNATISGGGTSIGGGNVGVTNLSVGLSAPYMQALGFTSMFTNTSFLSVVGNAGGGTQTLIFSIMGAILFLVTSFVFFAISVMLIVRYIVLIILMMLSPVAYMGLALPFMKPYANQWWESLKGQLLFAPIFMFMSLIILTLMSSPNFITITGGGVSNWGEIVNPGGGAGGGAVGLLINFAVIIGLTIGSLIIAKSTASKGSDMIKTVTGKAGAYAGGLVMGGTARLSRATVGRAGDAVRRSETLQNLAFKKDADGNLVARSGVSGWATRGVLKTGDKAATSTFDVRGSNAYKALDNSAGTKGLFGKASDSKKDTYDGVLKKKNEKEEKMAKLLKPNDDKYAEAQEKDKAEKARLKEVMDSAEKEKDKAEKEKKDTENKLKETRREIEKKQKELEESKLEETKEIIKKDLERLSAEEKTQKETLENLEKLAEKQDKAFKDAKKVHDDYKDTEEKKIKEIYENRVNAYADAVESGNAISKWTREVIGSTGKWGVAISEEMNAQNKVRARKIRGVLKGKSAADELKEIAKKLRKEAKDKGEGGWDDDEPKEEKGGEGEGEKKEGGEGEAKTT